ncbi:hypothetical protein C8242_12005 [Paracidovorax avenae]|nr:hypothetical protein C8242_12005 [Paracidovorax avenae]
MFESLAKSMERGGVPFDVEGAGYGFRVVRRIAAEQPEMPPRCDRRRPDRSGVPRLQSVMRNVASLREVASSPMVSRRNW